MTRRQALATGLLLACAGLAPAAGTALPAPEQAAVASFLDEAKPPGGKEATEAHGSALGDLDGDGVAEIVLVWTTVGAKQPTKSLTVLGRREDGTWRTVASTALEGEVALGSVAQGIIVVDRWPLRPPPCCPGKKYEDRYLLMEGRLERAK